MTSAIINSLRATVICSYRVHNSPPLVLVLSQMSPVHILPFFHVKSIAMLPSYLFFVAYVVIMYLSMSEVMCNISQRLDF